MLDIKSMTLVEMGDYFRQLGEPAFRAKQVFTWLHRGVKSFDEMSNLSKSLRQKLAQSCHITVPRVAKKQEVEDIIGLPALDAPSARLPLPGGSGT